MKDAGHVLREKWVEEFDPKLICPDVEDWHVLMTAEEMAVTMADLAKRLDKAYAGRRVLCPVLLKGAFVFAADFARAVHFPNTFQFLTASSYGSGEVQSNEVKISGGASIPEGIDEILIIDELFDTGKTLASVRTHYEALGFPGDHIKTCTIFGKVPHAAYPVPDHVGIEDLPPLWLAGYGLDLDGFARGWPHLMVRVTDADCPGEGNLGERRGRRLATIRAEVVDKVNKMRG